MEYRYLISVIIPVYNVQDYLERCMESVLSQSYTNLEILLVDDGTKDCSGVMCDEYARRDARVKVIHKANGGLSSARNAALDVAKGDYIGFVDSDDYIHKRMYEKLIDSMIQTNSDIVVCGHFTEQGDRISIEEPVLDRLVTYEKREALYTLVDDVKMNNYAWDKLYKAELFREIRYPEGRNYEDIATTYLLFDQANRVTQIPEYLYYYQKREGSISSHKDERKWFANCCQIIKSNKERISYFNHKGYREIEQLTIAKTLPYVFEAIKRAKQFKEPEIADNMRQILRDNAKAIENNPYISDKDKKAVRFYWSSVKYSYYEAIKKPVKRIKNYRNKINAHTQGKFDFSLPKGKSIRYVIFELPCFDNLGDHAIAYAQKKMVEALIGEKDQIQLYQVDGWQTVEAINSLKKVIGKDDVIFLQGGGNFGNLYDFAQVFRNKVLKRFANNKIFIFPQTMYFTDDKIGKMELEKCKKIFAKCAKLTIMARDGYSYEMMKKAFPTTSCKERNDVVSYLDESQWSTFNRKGILFCLRSDIEGNINAEQHHKLLAGCEMVANVVKVTDTCQKCDILASEREKVLEDKWRLFGEYRLVVTDRLHGMIFSLITATPCIVLGNNHHKVKETYKTFSRCNYLHYANSMDEAIELISEVYSSELPCSKYVVGEVNDFWSK